MHLFKHNEWVVKQQDSAIVGVAYVFLPYFTLVAVEINTLDNISKAQ